MNCPICQQEGITELSTTCPNCQTNLLALKMVDAIEVKYVENKKEKIALEGDLVQQKKDFEYRIRKKNRHISWLWFLLILLPLLFYCFGDFKDNKQQESTLAMDNILAKHRQQMNQKTMELDHKKKEIEALTLQLNAIEGTNQVRTIKYIVQPGDVLNDLAKLFYNDSTAWYQIALDNKIHDVRGLPVGDTILIYYRN